MKEYSFNFFFPQQPGSRQEHTERVQATGLHTAFSRAWRQLKHNPKYKGRRGLENVRIGVVVLRGWTASGQEVPAEQT